MSDPASAIPGLCGGEWLLRQQSATGIFTPERLTDEQQLVGRTVAGFLNDEVTPARERLEQKDWALARHLLRRCGELGLLGVDVPEADGGTRVDTVTSMVVSERLSRAASFGVTFGAQVNLAILPLSLFGTDEQKRRFLPGLMSGDVVGAYCLSEPSSGSDALGARARASKETDGSFVLNGEKAWITNGGIADLFIVFAKVDGEHFSAFLVERTTPGITTGPEEHKMGLHGSSTTSVNLRDVRVPAGNLLGDVGRGHKVALNILNCARLKLGATCAGVAIGAIGEAAQYAASRKQFGRPIGSFGAIKHKIGDMTARTYAVESLNYRIAGLLDARIDHAPSGAQAALPAFEEHAVEAAIAKVAGSEILDFVLDENVQIHGGNGFVRGYAAERHYRDARVNRIFEGTNEINRLLIPTLLVRRGAAGRLPLAAAIEAARAGEQREAHEAPWSGGLANEHGTVAAFRRTTLLVLGQAMATYGERLSDEQEVLMRVADMLIDLSLADSAVLRADAAINARLTRAPLHADAARVFVNDAAVRLAASAREALAAMRDASPAADALDSRGLLPDVPAIDAIALRRRLSDETVARGAYLFAE